MNFTVFISMALRNKSDINVMFPLWDSSSGKSHNVIFISQ